MFNTSGGYSLADIAAATGRNNDNDGFGGNGAWWIIILFLFAFCGWGNGAWGASNYGPQGSGTGSTVREEISYGFDMNGLENSVRGVQNGLCDGFYSVNTSLLNGFHGIDNAVCTLGYQTAQLVNGVQNTIQQGNNATQVAMMQGFNGVQAGQTALGTQLAQCCCDNRAQLAQMNYDAGSRAAATDNLLTSSFANLNYNIADQNCQTRRALTDSTTAIIANQDANTRSILDFLTQDKIATLTAENQSLKFAASQAAQNTYLIDTLQPCAKPAYIVCNPYTGGYGNGCNSGCGC